MPFFFLGAEQGGDLAGRSRAHSARVRPEEGREGAWHGRRPTVMPVTPPTGLGVTRRGALRGEMAAGVWSSGEEGAGGGFRRQFLAGEVAGD